MFVEFEFLISYIFSCARATSILVSRCLAVFSVSMINPYIY